MRPAWCRPAGAGPGTRRSWSLGRCTARRPACEDGPLGDHCKARPKIPEALAGVPRAAKNGTGPKYEDTNIYLRGRVLARLREVPAPGGATLPDLARRIDGNADVEPRSLKEVVESLERDGLARVTHASERPEHGPGDAVAEARAPYAAGPEREDLAEIRVSLP